MNQSSPFQQMTGSNWQTNAITGGILEGAIAGAMLAFLFTSAKISGSLPRRLAIGAAVGAAADGWLRYQQGLAVAQGGNQYFDAQGHARG